jgi:hypothetical protein
MHKILQAENASCKRVKVPHDIRGRAAKMHGLDLTAHSLNTVKTLATDAAAAEGCKL